MRNLIQTIVIVYRSQARFCAGIVSGACSKIAGCSNRSTLSEQEHTGRIVRCETTIRF